LTELPYFSKYCDMHQVEHPAPAREKGVWAVVERLWQVRFHCANDSVINNTYNEK
jgi:hypothetical protein